jgi:ABC-2 type transport system permease protein
MKLFLCLLVRNIHQKTMYRFEFLMQIFRFAVMGLSMFFLWDTLYQQSPAAYGLGRAQMVTYGLMGIFVMQIMNSTTIRVYVRDQVCSGRVEHDLMKPLNLQWHLFCRDASQRVVLVALQLLPVILLFFVFRGIYLPDPQIIPEFAASLLLAYLVLFAADFLFCMVMFVTLSITQLYFAYASIAGFLAGQLFPLWLMPDWAQSLVRYLPFRCMYDIPMSIYIGRTDAAAIWGDLALQLVWAVALLGLGQWVWQRIRHRLVVQGR